MENNYLKYSFMPKFVGIKKDFQKVLVCNSPTLLKLGIMSQVTNGLGYNKIRESKKTNISTEELYAHLEKMNKRVKSTEDNINSFSRGYLVGIINEYESFCDSIIGKVEEIYGLVKNLPETNSLINSIEMRLKDMDAEIDKGKIKEKKKENIVPEKREKKKSLLNRIFNF